MDTSSKKLASDDLAALFAIELAPGADGSTLSATVDSALFCARCHGKGKFLSYSGRVVGDCFVCQGTGLARGAGVRVREGDCPKCFGSGEWRPGRSCFACDGSGRAVADRSASIDVSAIATAFERAMAAGIKRPRLRLDDFAFSRAPDHGRNAGAIYVKRKSDGEYLGKVTGGQFHATRSCDDPTRERVIVVAADPAASARAYGQKTGECSCCGRELTNGESIALGIGPICRERFGWGG